MKTTPIIGRMSYQHYVKSQPFDRWSQEYRMNEITKEHLTRLYNLCRQCGDREILIEEIQVPLDALGQDQEKVKSLGRSLTRALKIENLNLRHASVMGLVEGIFVQFGRDIR